MTSDATADHLILAVEDIDTRVAALNTQIDQLRVHVDHLVEARVQLVKIAQSLNGVGINIETAPATVEPATKTTPKSKSKGSGRDSKYDLAEVAAVARAAQDAGKPVADAVFTEIDACPSLQMAGFLVGKARKEGHDIPHKRARRRQTVTQPVDAPTVDRTPHRSQNHPFVRLDVNETIEAERRAGLT